MAIIKGNQKVIGAITYRPFDQKEFAEIVFCAIHSDNQVRVRIFFFLISFFQKFILLFFFLYLQRDMDLY